MSDSSHIGALQIHSSASGQTLTPEQKRFNKLIRQIEQARQTLAAWNDSIALYAQAHVRVLLPLQASHAAASRQWAFALDALLSKPGKPGWTRAERRSLRDLLCEAAGALLGENDEDAELERFSPSTTRSTSIPSNRKCCSQ